MSDYPTQPPPPPPPPPGAHRPQGDPGSGVYPPPPPPPGVYQQSPGGYQAGYEPQYQLRRVPTDAKGRPLADWWRRAVAIIVDSLVFGVPSYVVFFLVLGLRPTTTNYYGPNGNLLYSTTTGAGLAVLGSLLIVAVGLVYFALLDGSEKGQTVGKMIMGIATRDAITAGSIGPARAFLRRLVYDLLWWALWIPGLLNVLWPLWDDRRQAWHDKAANSVVVDVSGRTP